MENIKNELSQVINDNFCIGCGSCAFNNPKLKIEKNKFGLLSATYTTVPDEDESEVCPFTSTKNESTLSTELYAQIGNINFDSQIGYYSHLYAGYVTEGSFRENASSGGMTTWILEQLFKEKLIDAVIHVGEISEGELFGYKISRSLEEIKKNSKTKYYPTHFDKVLEEINIDNGLNYAFVGIPCYIKAVRLLCQKNFILNKNIKFFIGIFCGHLKSEAFSQALAWQQNVLPKQLRHINYRVKNKLKSANYYSIEVEGPNKIKNIELNSNLYGTDWGLGYFKPKGCDWCDDISAETADIVCGDAWLPEYSQDSNGTNIVIIRNQTISNIINKGIRNNNLCLDTITPQKIIQSQAANYRHRQEGLSVRILNAQKNQQWHPKKRINGDSFLVSKKREKIYLLRSELSEKSHVYFEQAKVKKCFSYFMIKMLPLELKYYALNRRIVKGSLKFIYYFSRNLLMKKL